MRRAAIVCSNINTNSVLGIIRSVRCILDCGNVPTLEGLARDTFLIHSITSCF